MDMTVTDELFAAAQRKVRSASVCAPALSSMEAMAAGSPMSSSGGAVAAGAATPSGRRRRPATRSQSARISNKSVRRRPNAGAVGSATELSGSNSSMRSGTSEPRLNADSFTPLMVASGSNTPENASPAGLRRRGPSRRATSMHYAHTGSSQQQHPQRKSAAFLDVPDSSARGPDEDDDSYRLRSFSFTSKGVVNRGDSFRRRRSRSNSLLPAAAGPAAATATTDDGVDLSKNATPPQSRMARGRGAPPPDQDVLSYRVAMLGAPGVGKTALVSQFMTSECINAYDRPSRDTPTEQSVCIMLNGEESEMQFINVDEAQMATLKSDPPDAFVVMFSVIDKASFQKAEQELQRLQDQGLLRGRPAILVANKIDLARSRAVSTQDGKCLACTYRSKFTEISVGINHNVDELLVGILTQIRLKKSASDRDSSGAHWYRNRGVVRASMKARQMFTWIFGREDTKFKNCENLHIN